MPRPPYLLAFFAVFLLFIFPSDAVAQEIVMGATARVSSCSATFTDRGGPDGNHAPAGSQDTITICPEAGNTTAIRLDFTTIELDGTLSIFDGADAGAELIRELGRVNNAQEISLTATTDNPTGCLTVVFESTGDRPGWVAGVSCVSACQDVEAEIAGSRPEPNEQNLIRACVGQAVQLTGAGRYPESGTDYTQNDGSSTFRWDWGDGTRNEGREITHQYAAPGGYVVTLTVTDSRGCQSSNRVTRRVAVTEAFELNLDTTADLTLCPGEELSLSTLPGSMNDVVLTTRPQTIRFAAGSDSVARIDIPASSDEVRSSTLRLSGFGEDRKITSAEDFASLCLEIEHSFIGDLDMWLECPEGLRLDLLRYAPTDPNTAGKQRFGFGDRDNTGPEEAETYCWAPGAERTVDEQASTMDDSGNRPPILPFDREYQPLGDGFADLIGCSLNGPWTLYVRDRSPSDDGTVYTFDLSFVDGLGGDRGRITLTDSLRWANTPGVDDFSQREIRVLADGPGYTNVVARLSREGNCGRDTVLRIERKSPLDPDCTACPTETDTTIRLRACAGLPVSPSDLAPAPPPRTIRWTGAQTSLASTSDYPAVLPIAHQLPLIFSDSLGELREICMDVSNVSGLEETEVSLLPPSGEPLVLYPAGSLAGTSLRACLTPDDHASLTALVGTPINGNWELRLSGPGSTAALREWSVELVHSEEPTYSWSGPTDALSCTDCPDPVITTTEPATFVRTATTAGGCQRRTEFVVAVAPAPEPIAVERILPCTGTNDGAVLPQLDDPGLSFRWSTGATDRELREVPAGTYELTVSSENGCQRTLSYELPEAPPVAVSITVEDVSCGNAADGSIIITPGGETPVQDLEYTWPAGLGGPTTSRVTDLAAGSYPIVLINSFGCRLDTTLTVTAPPAFALAADVAGPSCAGEEDGAITVIPLGGTPTYAFEWEDGATGASRISLPPASYSVRVTDAAGCSRDTTLVLTSPPSLQTEIQIRQPVCAGEASGSIRIAASGGQGSYTYSLNGGEAQRDGLFGQLISGSYTVAAEDAGGCTLANTVVLEEGPEFSVEVGPDREIDFGDSLTVTGRVIGGRPPLEYQWVAGSPLNLSCISCPETTIRSVVSGQYRLRVTDAVGCTVQDQFRLLVLRNRALFIPSAISPNGDGNNDRLLVFGAAGTQVLTYRVYDRWGALLYRESDFPVGDPTVGWDGTDPDGSVLPTGTYVYTVEVRFTDGLTERRTGTVHLIR
jgi:gliding motility-associated-like protein